MIPILPEGYAWLRQYDLIPKGSLYYDDESEMWTASLYIGRPCPFNHRYCYPL